MVQRSCFLVHIITKKIVWALVDVWASILGLTKLSLNVQILSAKAHEKYYHIGTFNGIGLSTLGFSLKTERLIPSFFAI